MQPLNPDEANELWREGADTIREFLTEHSPGHALTEREPTDTAEEV